MLPRLQGRSRLYPGLPHLTSRGCVKGSAPEHGSHLYLATGQMLLMRNVATFQSAMDHVPAVSPQETPFFGTSAYTYSS